MWRYDRPKESKYYYCTLIADVKGKIFVYGDKRNFCKVDNIINSYRMEGEPLTGLGWVKDDDGFENEKVLAWSEDEVKGVCDKIPDNATVITLMNRRG